jgi:two-component system sensor histidine kinase KdpD
MHGHFDNSNLIMVYLMGVVFVATQMGRAASGLAAVVSVAAFDFFFVPPYLTFAVSDTQYLVTFTVMLLVGVVISTLAARVKAQAEAARRREQRTQFLYATSRDLAAAKTIDEVKGAVARHVSELMEGPSEILLPDAGGRIADGEPAIAGHSRETAVAQWALDHGRAAGLGTDTLPGSSALYVPLRASQSVVGVLSVRPAESLLPLAPDQIELVEALARQAASGLERVRLASAMETERLRSTLLSSVSHDLRTPLAAITGAASSLLQEAPLSPVDERALKESIYDEADRLGQLVTNLLDMTRLESGALQLNREGQSLEELVGAALARLSRVRRDRKVAIEIPPDLPLVAVDAVLVEQLLVNLFDNAFKYSNADSPIRVKARARADEVEVEVADDGPGLPPGEEERVFEKFHRANAAPRGFGLGLPICRAIVTAHGGWIRAEQRDPGAAFVFALPASESLAPIAEKDGD